MTIRRVIPGHAEMEHFGVETGVGQGQMFLLFFFLFFSLVACHVDGISMESRWLEDHRAGDCMPLVCRIGAIVGVFLLAASCFVHDMDVEIGSSRLAARGNKP